MTDDAAWYRDVFSAYARTLIFGAGAGVFAAMLYTIMYHLWMSAFLLNRSINLYDRLLMEIRIAGLQHDAIMVLIPVMAGVLFVTIFYRKGNLVELLIQNALAAVIISIVFFLASPFQFNMSPLERFLSALTSYGQKQAFLFDAGRVIGPLAIGTVTFIFWASIGAVIFYMFINEALIEREKDNVKHSGIIGLALVSAVAVAPPAIAYIATVI